jgi:Taurine catabolism dioxygenase TauD, TfdA family
MAMENTPGERMRAPAVAGREVVDPALWTGAEMALRDDWRHCLEAAEIDGLAAMVAGLRGRIGDDPNRLLALARDAFDLGPFAATLAAAFDELKGGRGFAVISGLPVADWPALDVAIAYWGIGRHIGVALSNNAAGDMIGHVTDLGKDYADPNHRGYQTSAGMDYHVDQCDAVALLCIRAARSGGRSRIVSSIAVHNAIVQRRPDLAAELTRPYCWSRHGEIGPGQKPWYETPLFNYVDGYLSVASGPKHIEKGHAMPGTPDLTPRQTEAFAMLDAVCDELHLGMELHPGDIQMVNNSVIMHTRTAYEDWLEPARRRRLWRLWMRVEGLRPLTPFLENWRDGVRTKDTVERIVL